VLLALAAVTIAMIVQPPMYRSTATLFVRTPGDVSRVVDGGDSYAQARARTYSALLSSREMSGRVVADLGLGVSPDSLSRRIVATNPAGTAIIEVTVSAPSPTEAQRTASVVVSEFSATVRSLESVPGSLVPRADLVVVDRPGPPSRVVAWGVPVASVLLLATLVGAVLGALGAVLRTVLGQAEESEAEYGAVDDDTSHEARHRLLTTPAAQPPNGGTA
jgi:capsular polysaccharide biosynthesis protein